MKFQVGDYVRFNRGNESEHEATYGHIVSEHYIGYEFEISWCGFGYDNRTRCNSENLILICSKNRLTDLLFT